MIIVPCYELVMLPGVTYYLQKDVVESIIHKDVTEGEDVVFLMQKREIDRHNTGYEDFYPIGVRGVVEKLNQDGNLAISTSCRVYFNEIYMEEGEIKVEYAHRADIFDVDPEEEKAELTLMKRELIQFVSGYPWGPMMKHNISHWNSLEEMIASLSYQLRISNEEKYKILEADELSLRHERIIDALYETMELMQVGSEAQRTQTEADNRVYREEAIKKQIQILQDELDEMHPENITDVRKFELKIQESGMNETARAEADKILGRMKQEGKNSHEYGMLYEYLDFVTSLSWKKEEAKDFDLKNARAILDEDHYGLEKPKKRILQQLAVMSLNKKQSGSILLFVGAPGTGKTSIGQSIAKALGRKYARISLGGVRDEAEIRGHRRTYVGAMPGGIMEGIKRSGASNPVVVLDEVDKMASSYNGDPASALLEVLDPEQNSTFTDHYMNVPYDLSDVLFICTANSTDTIPEPLLDRMEVIHFQGYTESEKMQIAKKHLLPKSMETMGIGEDAMNIPDETIRTMISDYTMEAGVRGLKKTIDSVCRTAALKLVEEELEVVGVENDSLNQFVDWKPIRHDRIKKEGKAGVVTGLAWTQAGGDILFIETMFSKGKGKITITGQLGDVMKESVQIAVSLVKAMYPEKTNLFEENDLHIHVPAGAVPKDGPSAGVTLVTALSSLVTGRAVSPKIAMTGEVSLCGDAMVIGGLNEKLGAAVRAGVEKVFIPKGNVEDLDDVAEEIKEKLEIVPVDTIIDILRQTGIME